MPGSFSLQNSTEIYPPLILVHLEGGTLGGTASYIHHLREAREEIIVP
jgi:hypothetical protein